MFFNKIGEVSYSFINAGSFWSDGGAAFGVLPKSIWSKSLTIDEKNRVEFALNLLLIKNEEGKLILVDTGTGDRFSEKEKSIYRLEKSKLLSSLEKMNVKPEDIDFVVLTHLHFDHAGGIVSEIDGKECLSFCNAIHIIQKSEWETAKNPDELNKAAYQFQKHLSLLSKSDKLLLIDGTYNLGKYITLEKTGGHSEGMQIVRIEDENNLAVYAGDIVPQEFLMNLPVISAYDLSRKDSFLAKKKILNDLSNKKGKLLLNHDINKVSISF